MPRKKKHKKIILNLLTTLFPIMIFTLILINIMKLILFIVNLNMQYSELDYLTILNEIAKPIAEIIVEFIIYLLSLIVKIK